MTGSAQDPGIHWQLSAPRLLAWREWDGECVVFDECKGSTHHLAPGAALLFLALATSPAPLPLEPLMRLALETSVEPCDADTIEAALLSLERSGLVERAPL